MKHFFEQTSDFSLTFFGPIHLLLILFTFLSILGIYKYRKKLKKYTNIKNIIIGILFINMIVFVAGAILTGNFDIQVHLPIHYCYITGFAFMYMLFKEKKEWFNSLYYAIFFCTITVIIFQDPSKTYDRFDFYFFIISHHFMLISSFYTLYVLDYNVNKFGYKTFACYTVLVYSIVFIINKILGTNYIFNEKFPDFIYEYLPFLNNYPPLIWLLILAVPLLLCAYLPIKYKDKR